VAITGDLVRRNGREKDTYEYQMLYGIRPNEQLRHAARGERMRVYVPYGDEWYGYLVRRMAERPANLVFFLRSLATKG
jgi:proline dehydrogenase